MAHKLVQYLNTEVTMDILFDVYDSVGNVSIDSGATVLFDRARTLYEGVILSSGEISLSFPIARVMPPYSRLLYLNAKITTDVSSGNNRSLSKTWVEVDSGSGFEIVPGTDGYIYNRTIDAGLGSALINTSYTINKLIRTVKFRIRVQRTVGTNSLITAANASNFICMAKL